MKMRKQALAILLIIIPITIIKGQSASMVKDIWQGQNSSNIRYKTKVGSNVYFITYAIAPDIGTDLWKSDGTASGTLKIKNIPDDGSSVKDLTESNGIVFFSVGNELWKSDGTANGTTMLKSFIAFNPNANTGKSIVNMNGAVYFSAINDSLTSAELWKSNGTASGTVMVKNINPNPNFGSYPMGITNVNGVLYFLCSDGNNMGLFKSDGTSNGTNFVKDVGIEVYGNEYPFIDVNGSAFFNGADQLSGSELWKTDGTLNGTVLVKDISSGSNNSYLKNMIKYNNQLFFTRYNKNSKFLELWKSDGTNFGTQMVKQLFFQGDTLIGENTVLNDITIANNKLFFTILKDYSQSPLQLWCSDGTSAGTDSLNNFSFISSLTEFNNNLFFKALKSNNSTIYSLWKSDGTLSGTIVACLIDSLNGSSSIYSFEKNFIKLSPSVFLFDGFSNQFGEELWKYDLNGNGSGSTNASQTTFYLVKDIANSIVYNDSEPEQFTEFAGATYFVVNDYNGHNGPWVSDGTLSGTHAVAPNLSFDFCNFLGQFDGKLYFVGTNTVTGSELWYTDGTSSGTQLLKDIYPGNYSSNPSNFTLVDNKLFFTANDGTHGFEWWITDGTSAGTHLTVDLEAGPLPVQNTSNSSGIAFQNTVLVFSRLNETTNRRDLWIFDNSGNSPTNLTQQFNSNMYTYSNAVYKIEYNNKIYFNFNQTNEGDELFVTDGTISGTSIVNLNVGSNSFTPREFLLFNNKLCFTGSTPTTTVSSALFISDGTVSGTTCLNVGFLNTSGRDYIINNQTLYFNGLTNSNGYELWKTNGTVGGTSLIKDIKIGTASSGPSYLTWCNNKLYFSADDGTNQRQPWVSDGTAAGTTMLKNIYNGTNGSYSKNFTEYNGKTYFTARIANNDFHLFETDGTSMGTNTIIPVGTVNTSNPLGSANVTVGSTTPIKITDNKIYMRGSYHNLGKELYVLGTNVISVKENEKKINSDIIIFPNPTNGIIYLKANQTIDKGTIEIINIQGQSIYKSNKIEQQIDLSNQAKGIYFIQLVTEQNTFTKKIILQ